MSLNNMVLTDRGINKRLRLFNFVKLTTDLGF